MEDNKAIWNECFNKVEEGLKLEPVCYRDEINLTGEAYLKELYEELNINSEDGIRELVDLIANLIDSGGYSIIWFLCH